jgi:hypothetical protein
VEEAAVVVRLQRQEVVVVAAAGEQGHHQQGVGEEALMEVPVHLIREGAAAEEQEHHQQEVGEEALMEVPVHLIRGGAVVEARCLLLAEAVLVERTVAVEVAVTRLAHWGSLAVVVVVEEHLLVEQHALGVHMKARGLECFVPEEAEAPDHELVSVVVR